MFSLIYCSQKGNISDRLCKDQKLLSHTGNAASSFLPESSGKRLKLTESRRKRLKLILLKESRGKRLKLTECRRKRLKLIVADRERWEKAKKIRVLLTESRRRGSCCLLLTRSSGKRLGPR
jgi:hypothetical protein